MREVLILIGLICQAHACLQRIDQMPGVRDASEIIQRDYNFDKVEQLVAALGLDPDYWSLEEGPSRYIKYDLTRQRLNLYYEGLRVRGFTLQASINSDGQYTGAVSGYVPDISHLDISAGAGVRRKDVKQALVQYVNDNNVRINQGDIDSDDLEHFYFEREIYIDHSTGKASVIFFAKALVNIPNYIRTPKALFDCDLNVIKGRVKVRNKETSGCPNAQGGNVMFPGLTYGPGDGELCLDVRVRGDTCILHSRKFVVKDVLNELDRSKAEIVKFPCKEGLKDESNDGFSANADAFYFSHVFYDVLKSWGKQTEPFDDHITTLYTHYAMWPNAFWDGYAATFGSGDENVYPYAVREVIGHELGHAVTEHSENLVFDGESVAIDEAFADICGKAISAYLDPSFNWKFADNLIRSARDALRYFDDPTRDGRTIANVNDFQTVITDHPALGVGVFDKFFYLVVTDGVPFPDAFEAVVLANRIYWHGETGFYDGACGVLRAASDLNQDVSKYRSAFMHVGINLSFCGLDGTA
ncbi:metalloprotease [Plakobranchus ocellatus]|uniref:Metalloprotease n=1 Tax=Plakobranchus ocellatus TaxID=259542 RepID=A0AAV4CQ38_9GAST|nr:metalloprotease [Plakobranchus ocellatus]